MRSENISGEEVIVEEYATWIEEDKLNKKIIQKSLHENQVLEQQETDVDDLTIIDDDLQSQQTKSPNCEVLQDDYPRLNDASHHHSESEEDTTSPEEIGEEMASFNDLELENEVSLVDELQEENVSYYCIKEETILNMEFDPNEQPKEVKENNEFQFEQVECGNDLSSKDVILEEKQIGESESFEAVAYSEPKAFPVGETSNEFQNQHGKKLASDNAVDQLIGAKFEDDDQGMVTQLSCDQHNSSTLEMTDDAQTMNDSFSESLRKSSEDCRSVKGIEVDFCPQIEESDSICDEDAVMADDEVFERDENNCDDDTHDEIAQLTEVFAEVLNLETNDKRCEPTPVFTKEFGSPVDPPGFFELSRSKSVFRKNFEQDASVDIPFSDFKILTNSFSAYKERNQENTQPENTDPEHLYDSSSCFKTSQEIEESYLTEDSTKKQAVHFYLTPLVKKTSVENFKSSVATMSEQQQDVGSEMCRSGKEDLEETCPAVDAGSIGNPSEDTTSEYLDIPYHV